MNRPRLLDLFCGAGGAAMGYHRAGFDVTGVDIAPQSRYPFPFVQADAMSYPLDGYDAIHASPVCLGYANVTAWRGDPAAHPRQLAPVIARLAATGRPAVIENVPEALDMWDEVLCGSNFGLAVKRHRGFLRVGWSAFDLLHPCQHRGLLPFMHKGERAYADAMGCTWMSKTEARQAIPPAYTEYIGAQLLDALEFPAQEPAGRGTVGG
jgi:DNA (cytosine-5)-methyltransferase 1